jgi:hypothetical protein
VTVSAALGVGPSPCHPWRRTVELTGADHTLWIVEHIVDASGDFAGSTGTVAFDGIIVNGAGIGGIRGQWNRPHR